MDNFNVFDANQVETRQIRNGDLAKLTATLPCEAERERKGFLFLPSFADSYEAFKKTGDMDLAHLFIDSVIAYGTERKRITNNPIICAVMASVERTIDAGDAKHEEMLRKKAEREKKKKEKEEIQNQNKKGKEED